MHYIALMMVGMRCCVMMLLVLTSAVPAGAVEIVYQPPRLSISANNEPLDRVLRALGKQMHIQINAPAGLNQPITIRIVNQPVKRALHNLLRGKNYVLQWEDGGKRPVALTLIIKGMVSSPVVQPVMSVNPSPRGYGRPQQLIDPVMVQEEKADEDRLEADEAAEKAFDAERERSIQLDEQDHDQ